MGGMGKLGFWRGVYYDVSMSGGKLEAINKKKLAVELLVALGIVLVVFLVRFLPWLMEQPVPWYDPMRKYQNLVNVVNEYDYSKGRDAKLESRLDNATISIGSDPLRYYFNQKAKAIYYFNVGEYQASIDALDMAIGSAPSMGEMGVVYALYMKNYAELGQAEEVELYRDLYDGLPLDKAS